MLAEIVAALQAHSTLSQAFELYNGMMGNAKQMYQLAMGVLRGTSPVDEVRDTLYALDRDINEKERAIRRILVNHLSLKAGQDGPACLVLMSVTKEAERLGDYCKNLFEVAEMFGQPLAQGRYMTPLVDISEKIKGLLAKTGEAFVQSERGLALEVVQGSHVVANECEMIVKQLMHDNIPTQKAVAYSLLSRYFKRLARHLGNIASSVLVGVDEIDFEGFAARGVSSHQ
jgi:phosphate uptake regulator